MKEAIKSTKINTGGASSSLVRIGDWLNELLRLLYLCVDKAAWADSVGFSCNGTKAEIDRREAQNGDGQNAFTFRSSRWEKFDKGEKKNAKRQRTEHTVAKFAKKDNGGAPRDAKRTKPPRKDADKCAVLVTIDPSEE